MIDYHEVLHEAGLADGQTREFGVFAEFAGWYAWPQGRPVGHGDLTAQDLGRLSAALPDGAAVVLVTAWASWLLRDAYAASDSALDLRKAVAHDQVEAVVTPGHVVRVARQGEPVSEARHDRSYGCLVSVVNRRTCHSLLVGSSRGSAFDGFLRSVLKRGTRGVDCTNTFGGPGRRVNRPSRQRKTNPISAEEQ